ncbi:primosomal protein N' [Arthrobacter sp. M4]|uniref:primosomal protein N' n=1 Tax=Arthrobacter sp. M4 TaxID=218160 RepID=UPI001CDB9F2B|nr:primosomal protein N' [Arthrobacter sp. M4]MCA4131371.1 primosomal protein N' [Arthrobacter sp. M4]
MPSEGVQPSLLQGFPAKQVDRRGPALTADLPVAKVLLESPLPHLDRPFDYSVPRDLDVEAQPGVRVKVRFSGQELNGFILERAAESDTAHELTPLHKVVSAVRVLTPAVLELADAVSARYAGTLSDVLRTAIPPRVARLEKDYLDQFTDQEVAEQRASAPGGGMPGALSSLEFPAWNPYVSGHAFLGRLAQRESPRAVVSALRGYGGEAWPELIAGAVAAVRASGRGAVVVVPDYRDLDRMEQALAAVLPAEDIARLTADDGPTPRYRSYLRLLSGSARVAVGTRSAAYAPVKDLGLVVCWDDGDDLHIDQRAPYAHSREVLLLRSTQEDAACLFAAHSRSTELQRLVESGWAVAIEAPRAIVRQRAPRVVSTADSFEQERDPLARIARLPGAAWRAARNGLEHGPVLVQVARAGYAPSLACERCREPARCPQCQGPLALGGAEGSTAIPQCRWCATPAPEWSCRHCGGTRLRRGVVGALRTAEELGRAFPGTTVVTSSRDQVKAVVQDKPALVVATVGAEPVAPTGYAAALLLDGNSLLRRENLRAAEDSVRRWFNAAALVRPANEGGLVVITADDSVSTGALVRWDSAGFAARELSLRQELGLPPAVRIASLTGERADVEHLTAAVTEKVALRTAGPTPVDMGTESQAAAGTTAPFGSSRSRQVRTLLFIPYGQAAQATAALRALKAATAAKRAAGPVQVRLDGVDVL